MECSTLAHAATIVLAATGITSSRRLAKLAVLIEDEYQGRGFGSELSRRIIEIARSEKLDRVTVEVLGEIRPMVEVGRGLGFHMDFVEGGVAHEVLTL